jgi:hypothetical protein
MRGGRAAGREHTWQRRRSHKQEVSAPTRSLFKGGSRSGTWRKMVSSLRGGVRPDASSRSVHMHGERRPLRGGVRPDASSRSVHMHGERRPFRSEPYDPILAPPWTCLVTTPGGHYPFEDRYGLSRKGFARKPHLRIRANPSIFLGKQEVSDVSPGQACDSAMCQTTTTNVDT